MQEEKKRKLPDYQLNHRTPEWYFLAGRSFQSKFVVLTNEKQFDLADTIEETFKYHLHNLEKLGLEEHAAELHRGFRT